MSTNPFTEIKKYLLGYSYDKVDIQSFEKIPNNVILNLLLTEDNPEFLIRINNKLNNYYLMKMKQKDLLDFLRKEIKKCNSFTWDTFSYFTCKDKKIKNKTIYSIFQYLKPYELELFINYLHRVDKELFDNFVSTFDLEKDIDKILLSKELIDKKENYNNDTIKKEYSFHEWKSNFQC